MTTKSKGGKEEYGGEGVRRKRKDVGLGGGLFLIWSPQSQSTTFFLGVALKSSMSSKKKNSHDCPSIGRSDQAYRLYRHCLHQAQSETGTEG